MLMSTINTKRLAVAGGTSQTYLTLEALLSRIMWGWRKKPRMRWPALARKVYGRAETGKLGRFLGRRPL